MIMTIRCFIIAAFPRFRPRRAHLRGAAIAPDSLCG